MVESERVRATPQPAGLSNETIWLLGQEPSVYARIRGPARLVGGNSLLVIARRDVST